MIAVGIDDTPARKSRVNAASLPWFHFSARFKKGDRIGMTVEITKVLDDVAIVVRVPGHNYPVMIDQRAADTLAKET